MSDVMEDALLVRRRVFDLTAGMAGLYVEQIASRTLKLRGLFFGIGRQTDDVPFPPPYTQRLFICDEDETLFLMLWDSDDVERLIGRFTRGEWERRLLP